MKKLLAALIVAAFALPAFGQTTPAGSPTSSIRSVTSLSACTTSKKGTIVVVTDDSVVGACDSAAGVAITLCRCNGSSWIKLGDGTSVGGALSSGDIDTSAELRAILTDESGTGALIFAAGNIGAGTATTAAANDSSTLIATTAYVQTELTAYASDTATFTNKTFDTAGAGNSLSINGVAATANTGTGAVARAAGPTFTTPTLGAATATTLNALTITSSTGTLTIPAAVVMTGPAASGTTATLGNVETFATGTKTVTSKFDFGGGTLEVPNSTSLPGTCVVGEIYDDTDATLGSNLYLCTSVNTWTVQGGGGAGSLTIGSSSISGGTSTRVLVEAAGPVLSDSANLTWVSPALTIGVATSTTGQLKLTGSSSGTITIQGQAAAGTYNFNLPTTSGTSNQVFLSGGGGASPNIWADFLTLPSVAQGDVLYADTTTSLAALNKNASATRYISNTGTNNNPAWAQVNLANGVTGNLPVTNLNSGTNADATHAWFGDGTWKVPSGSGTVTATGGNLTSNAVVLGAGTTDTKVIAGLTTDGVSKLNVGVAGGTAGGVLIANATSGTVELRPVAGALGTTVLTLPAGSDTLVTLTGSQTLTTKTLTSPVIGTSPTAAGATWTDLGSVTTIDINGGTIDGAVVGGSSAANGTFTTLQVNTNANPDANDGAGLGTGALGWSDLFLATGGLINWANGDAVITHSAGVLTVSTGDLKVTTAGTTATSVVTVGGTQTLTNKTLTSPTLTTPVLGTPSSGTLTNATGYTVANLAGAGTGVVAALAVNANANGGFAIVDGTKTLTNTTLDAAGTGNVLKLKGYIYLTHPHLCDGTNAIINTTATAITYGHATFSNSVDQATNYCEYYIQVPEDIDTSVALRGRIKVLLGGADTNGQRYVLSSVSVADSAVPTASTLANAINLDFAGDASGASGDVETSAWTTLTSWAGALTAGQTWRIRFARDGDTSDASTVNSTELGLVIEYGVTQ